MWKSNKGGAIVQALFIRSLELLTKNNKKFRKNKISSRKTNNNFEMRRKQDVNGIVSARPKKKFDTYYRCKSLF